MGKRNFVAGTDFGSDSVRVVIVDAQNGETISEGVCNYPRWAKKLYCEPEKSQFRQHPLDYIEAFTKAFQEALSNAGEEGRENLRAIGFDATGSTPCPVDEHGTPLALLDEFKDNPNAMFHLWKDHTATAEAEEINRVLSGGPVDYTKFQGVYQSEWFWAKVLHTTRLDTAVREKAYTWVEHCDWMPALLCGGTDPDTMYHCTCAAGHKVLWHSEFGGMPARDVLVSMDPYLGNVYDRYTEEGPKTADTLVGTISKEWAKRLGVNDDVLIGGSSLDAHAGGVGAGVGLHTLVKVVGTSAVDMTVENADKFQGKNLKTVLGLAENSIIPGYIGVEAGQAAFGDVYAWLRETLLWPVKYVLKDEELEQKLRDSLLYEMEKAIRDDDLNEDLVAIDWLNGRRYPVLNERTKGAVAGITMGTSVPDLYRSLILSTLFGAKRMFDGYVDGGVEVERIILVGGIAKKSSYIMQLMADLLDRPIMVAKETQMCAKGAAIYAAVAAGYYPDIPAAQKVFCEEYQANYFPNPDNAKRYEKLYEKYLRLGGFIDQEYR
ncbi:ribulokinase [Anaerolentibacter hominis]|uniref:ribulokinase n=1 Tax=Anaerolentibacter hominis TaxID=3079009 RepID=UPI0031B8702D